jgi:hypothetical protein
VRCSAGSNLPDFSCQRLARRYQNTRFSRDFVPFGILAAGSVHYGSASPLNGVFNLLTFLPSLAIGIRRLHDIDRTGWWVLIAFTIIGALLLILWACTRGTTGPNRFGGDPLAVPGALTPPPVA